MNIYYTAKDIEEMAAKGMKRLEIGPGIFLTDFARETAQQLDIVLVDGKKQTLPSPSPPVPSSSNKSRDNYNKPSGCQHGSSSPPAARSQGASPAGQLLESGDSTTVNRLIDLMGKAIERGR